MTRYDTHGRHAEVRVTIAGDALDSTDTNVIPLFADSPRPAGRCDEKQAGRRRVSHVLGAPGGIRTSPPQVCAARLAPEPLVQFCGRSRIAPLGGVVSLRGCRLAGVRSPPECQ